jgi:hypothetical protein
MITSKHGPHPTCRCRAACVLSAIRLREGLEQFGRSPILPDIDLSALSPMHRRVPLLCATKIRNASLPMRLSGLRAFRNAHCLGPGLRPPAPGHSLRLVLSW